MSTDQMKVYLNKVETGKWLQWRSWSNIPLKSNLNEIQNMKKVNFKDLKPWSHAQKFNESQMNTHINNLFTFWDENQTNAVQIPHFIRDLLSLGLAPNIGFVSKMLSILYHMAPDEVIKMEISREDFKKLV